MKNVLRYYARVVKLFKTLYSGHHTRLIGLSLTGVFAGFIEGLGISLVVPLFGSLLGDGDSALGDNFATRFLDSALSILDIRLSFQILLAAVALLFIGKAILLAYYGMKKTRIVSAYKVSTRGKLLKNLLGASVPFLRKQKLGHIDYVILTDVEASARMLDTAISAILHITTLITYVVVSVALSPSIALLTLTVGIIALIALRPVGRKLRVVSKTLVTTSKEIARTISEVIIGIKSIKAFGAEQTVLRRTAALFDENERAEVRKLDLKTFIKVSVEPITVLFVLAIFAISYKFLTFDLGAFVPIIYLTQQIFLRIEKVQTSINLLNGVFPHARSLECIIESLQANAEPQSGTGTPMFDRDIALEKISFGHGGAEVIHDIHIAIKRGETIGILGPSGSGKTTLADLMLRFVDPTSGTILLDGKNLSGMSIREWRTMAAYVSQEVFLKNASIAENIRFYDSAITDEQIMEAAQHANVYDFVSALPDGFHTIVGERGSRLSGGERQRIALARALVRKPSILILDEATSSLDNESERAIRETLRQLKGSMTMIVIAHRLSTVTDADRIYVVDKGMVRESGAPHELLRDTDSYFYKMSRLGNVTI
ncbi:MAG: ABC transporter ATP-binding protein [Candidatus Vogelbacteria bacterium]|nr:ABC transporter ATP-binding protein [Candidatus Vogelbacteria bacterium]